MTDAEGRFRITGIGRNRVAWLFSSKVRRLSASTLHVLTRPGKAVEAPHGGGDRPRDRRASRRDDLLRRELPPCRCADAADRRSRPGCRHREAAGGRPDPQSELASRPNYLDDIARTVTDAEGHFRLTGMPKGNGNTIVAVPEADQPYVTLREGGARRVRGSRRCRSRSS